MTDNEANDRKITEFLNNLSLSDIMIPKYPKIIYCYDTETALNGIIGIVYNDFTEYFGEIIKMEKNRLSGIIYVYGYNNQGKLVIATYTLRKMLFNIFIRKYSFKFHTFIRTGCCY